MHREARRMQLERRQVYERLTREELQARLDRELASLEESGDTERAQLLHELAVHQIELEMQNRELRDSKGQIGPARDRYADLFDDAPVGYAIVDRKGRMRDLNLRTARILGRGLDELKGRHLGALLLEPEDNAVLMRHLKLAYAGTAAPVVDEVRVRTPRGPIHLRLESILELSHGPGGCDRPAADRARAAGAPPGPGARRAHESAGGDRLGPGPRAQPAPGGAFSIYMSVARQRLRHGPGEESGVPDLLHKSERQIQRASAVLRRVRRFARLRPVHTGAHELAALVGRALSFLEPDIRQAGVRVRVKGGGATVVGDQYQLEQVLVYLVRNAVESIQDAEVADGTVMVQLGEHNWGRRASLDRRQRSWIARRRTADRGTFRPPAQHQDRRHWRRSVAQSLHHRGARRAFVGGAQRAPRRTFPVHPAVAAARLTHVRPLIPRGRSAPLSRTA